MEVQMETRRETGARSYRVFGFAERLMLLICQGFGLGVIIWGGTYAFEVFRTVSSQVQHPETFQASVDSISKLIDADKLVISQGEGQPLPLGKLISMGILFIWYFFWAWIPLAICRIGARLLWGPS